jgi:hypothetical protein
MVVPGTGYVGHISPFFLHDNLHSTGLLSAGLSAIKALLLECRAVQVPGQHVG